MCASVFHQWLHEYCPLKRQLSLACWRNNYLWRHPTHNSPTVQSIAAPRWPNDISSTADNAIFKNSAQNIECSLGCVARSAVLLKSNVAISSSQKFVQHGPITIAVDSNLLISKKNFPIIILDQNPHQTVTCFGCESFWGFNVCVRVLCVPKATILFVCVPVKIKMSFIYKDDFFFCQNQDLL